MFRVGIEKASKFFVAALTKEVAIAYRVGLEGDLESESPIGTAMPRENRPTLGQVGGAWVASCGIRRAKNLHRFLWRTGRAQRPSARVQRSFDRSKVAVTCRPPGAMTSN